ncbi:MAG: hypothetical protein COA90_06585 [Gammaproteobacteria bacterium]|nr:MAG: hypothetical protein COA90_06585 [Gammaproteobacteria bacterium]
MSKSDSNHTPLSVSLALASRVIAAILGGYILSNLIAIIMSYLIPGPLSNGVITGMLASFAIYTLLILWVFTARTTLHVWIGITLPSLLCAAWVYFLIPEGLL